MKIYTEILGNLSSPEWRARISGFDTEFVELDQWTAQKSRFVARGDGGGEYAVALERHSQLSPPSRRKPSSICPWSWDMP